MTSGSFKNDRRAGRGLDNPAWVFAAIAAACIWFSRPCEGQIEVSAYIANGGANDISVINTTTNMVVGSPIGVSGPVAVAVTPDGKYVYVTNGSNTISVIDAATNTVLSSSITLGSQSAGIAVTPNGKYAYVTDTNIIQGFAGNTVSVINTATNTVLGSPITVGSGALGIAITPDGKYAYVANNHDDTVSVINTATNTVIGSPIAVGNSPVGVAVTPNGNYVFVTNNSDNTVSVISTATHSVVGPPIGVGNQPAGVVITPDGRFAYVADNGSGNMPSNTVSVIDIATDTVVGLVTVGNKPLGIDITPDGKYVYVTNSQDGTVSVINTATNTVLGVPIAVGSFPISLGFFVGPNIIVAQGSPLSVANDAALTPLGFGQFVDFNGGTLKTTGDLVTSRTISLLLLGGTIDSNGFDVTFSGDIINSGSLTKMGAGTLTLSGNNAYTGGTNIVGGVLSVSSDSNLGTGGITISNNAELLTTGALFASTKAITLGTGGGTLASATGTTAAYGSVISGFGRLSIGDAINNGTIVLSAANTYSGGTNLNGGVLALNSDSNLGTGALSFNGGTLEALAAGGGIASSKAITLNAGGGTFLADAGTTSTLSGAISGVGAFTKNGGGTLALTGNNVYTGGTTINAGTLQIGNGGTTGSIVGNVTDNGSLILNRSDNVTFNAIISGSGNLAQNGSGITILGGINTYSGGTIINNGTLFVNNSQALGLGNVVVNGGVLGADPQPINVKGNYSQNAGGTLQLQVAGANPGQYDSLNVGGNATLGGTLQLISLGFQPKAGNQLTLVTTGGVVLSRFAQFVDPFATGPGFNTVDLVYGRNSVLLEFLNIVPPVPPVITTIDFSSFALTPNELAAANLLDAVQPDPRAANLISFLDKEPFVNLPGDFEKISPDGLTAIFEIGFSNANIQRLNLEGRMDDIHNGSTGFSSNMKLNGATANLENKPGVDGKSSKGVVEPILRPGPENRWGVWVTGFGDFVNVDADGNANGYDFTTGGFSLGIDYRIGDQLAIGAMGEYSHTWTALQPSGDIDVDSGRGGLYATWFNHGLYLNGAIYGGHNTYESSRSSLGGLATGGTEGAEWSTFISGGYDFHFGHLSVGPIAALQYTYVNINGFSENGSLTPLAIHSGSAESLRSDFGFRVFYQWQIGKVLVEPSLKAAWEHEYKYSALPITAGFAGIPGPSATFYGPNEGHDSATVSAGVTAQWTPAISTYVNYDGQLGRERYGSNAVTGGVRISF